MRSLITLLSASDGAAASTATRVVFVGARDADRARLRRADAGTRDVVGVARDGAQVHDVARLERERVERERRR